VSHEQAHRRRDSRPAKHLAALWGVKALTDISFEVREHEIRAIIGPTGGEKLDAERH